MLECKKITCLLAMSSFLDKLYRFILRAIWAIWLLYWLEREGCHQFAFCAFGQHNGTIFIHIKKLLSNGNQFSYLLNLVHPCITLSSCHRNQNILSPRALPTITFYFLFKLSLESGSLSKYQTALIISRHSLSCPDKTRSATSVNQTTLTSFQLFVNCNCLYPYCQKNKIIITQLALTRQELVHLSIRSGQEICFTNRQILLEFRLLLFILSLDLPGATNILDKCSFTFSLVV